jgi:hypothetical protein
MNNIQDWIKLHSTGSQSGSSSAIKASIAQRINKPFM